MANAVIGALRVMLGMDTAEFEEGANRAQRSAKKFERDMQKLGRKLGKIGKGMTLAVTAPLAAFGVSSFKAASDAAELQSAFDQTFGELAGTMNAWAEETGNALGRSTQSMQELANTFGIFFNQAAETREEAAKMSQTFAVLAQDLASFYNVSEDDALAKLRSGLAGEAEPLRDFGVFLSAAAVEARALEMGLAATSKELTEQDKIVARYNLILEGTANAQGDVSRTADGTANQMRKAAAAFEELQVKIGNVLLPVITPLIERLGELLDFMASLPDEMQTAIVVFAGLAAAAGPVLIVLGSLVTAAPAIAGAFGIIKVAMLGLLANPILLGAAVVIGGIVLAWQNWDTITAIVEGVGASVTNWYEQNIKPTMDAVTQVVRGFVDFFTGYFGRHIEATVALVSALMTGDFSGAWDAAKAIVANSVQAMAQVVQAVGPVIEAAFKAIYDAAKQWLMDRLGDALEFVQRKVKQVEEAFAWLYDKVVGNSWIPDMVEAIGREMGLLDGLMVSPAVSAADATSAAFEDASQSVQRSFAEMAEGALGSLDRLLGGIKGGGVSDILGGLLGIGQAFGVFGGGAGGLPTGGALGGGAAPSFDFDIPGFAKGGSMRLGGMAGLDRNLLSLNGSPLARVSAGETMTIRPANDAARDVRVTIVDTTGLFKTRVEGAAARVVAQAAPAIAQRGANEALSRSAQVTERRLA